MIVGLTGGIGSGKTTVSRMFEALGVPVYIADLEARTLMETSEEIKMEIIRLLGPEAYKNGKPDRPFIAGIVFKEKEKLEMLNHIIHPRVKEHFQKWYEIQNAPYVIKEAAVLIENGGYKECDKMILVTAPLEERIRRVMERDQVGMTEVLDRIQNQLSDDEKRKYADYVIENEDLQKTKKKVALLHAQLVGS